MRREAMQLRQLGDSSESEQENPDDICRHQVQDWGLTEKWRNRFPAKCFMKAEALIFVIKAILQPRNLKIMTANAFTLTLLQWAQQLA